MTMVNNWTSGHGALAGKYHELLTGRVGKTYSTPDGDASPWSNAPIGSLHMYEGAQSGALYAKIKDDNLDNDWAIISGWVGKRLLKADFTDATTTGTFTFTDLIPAGATVTHTMIRDVVAFTGDTTAVLSLGETSDADRYQKNGQTVDMFVVNPGPVLHANTVMDGVKYHIAAKAIIAKIVCTSDFTAVPAAAAVTVAVHYML